MRFDAESKLGEDSPGGNKVKPDRNRRAHQGCGADGFAVSRPLLQRESPGSSLIATQIEEVKSCNGYYSASDLRIHFGLNEAKKVDLVEIRWPSGQVDTLKDLDVNRLYVVEEGGKILKNEALVAAKKKN